MSGTSINIRNMDMNEAGIVSTHFQLASHNRCMKNMITSMALVQETAIINARATSLPNGHQLEYVKNEQAVSTHSAANTTRYLPIPPCSISSWLSWPTGWCSVCGATCSVMLQFPGELSARSNH